jgi:hypothetical protein
VLDKHHLIGPSLKSFDLIIPREARVVGRVDAVFIGTETIAVPCGIEDPRELSDSEKDSSWGPLLGPLLLELSVSATLDPVCCVAWSREGATRSEDPDDPAELLRAPCAR